MEFFAPYLNMAVTTLAILALLIICLLVYRALNRRVRGRKGARLGVSEYHEIDKSRRLILVRRDDTEHLILVGGSQDVVIESGIESALSVAPSYQPQMAASPQVTMHPGPVANQAGNVQPLPMRPPPRPAIFGERRPLRAVEPVMSSLRVNEDE
jgi:hypothetical protein